MSDETVSITEEAADARVGKLSPDRMAALIADSTGRRDANLVVGPGAGLDAAILKIGDDRVMAVAEDPIFPAAGLPLETFGWFTAHIGASDVAVTGVRPTHLTYSLLLPPGYPERDARTIITSVSDAAQDLGMTIVGGHTGWYGGIAMPIIGGITVWGFADADKWISPGGARDGDILLMTKGPAVEAVALLAVLRREGLRKKIGEASLTRALARTAEITVVADALAAFAAGGVHAMHDATEGGVLGGIWEMANAAGIPVAADIDAVPVPEDIAAVAGELGFDPWAAISEGTLLAAVEPESVGAVRAALAEINVPCWTLGRFDASLARDGRTKVGTLRRGGAAAALPDPGEDPFWRLFAEST
jgi:hydrogenase maturation factor